MLYKFEDFELNDASRTLHKSGDRINIEPKVFDLITLLIQQSPRIVSREEIIDELWDGRIVSESSIDTRISSARLAIGDNGKVQKLIKTYSSRGFSFIGELEGKTASKPHTTQTTGKLRSTRKLWPAALLTSGLVGLLLFSAPVRGLLIGTSSNTPDTSASLTRTYKLAVFPLDSSLNDEAERLFSKRVNKALIDKISHAKDLIVISETSATNIAKKDLAISTVGNELGITHIIEGSIFKDETNLSLVIKLIDTLKETILWSETYLIPAESLNDLAAMNDIIDDVTANISRELNLSSDLSREYVLSDELKQRYQRGIEFGKQKTAVSLKFARDDFAYVIANAPDYLPAYARIVIMYQLSVFYGDVPRDEADQMMARYASEAAKRAPDDISTLEAQGLLANFRQDWQLALSTFEKVISANPNNADAHLKHAETLHQMGRNDDAIRAYKQALEFNPTSASVLSNMTWLLVESGDVGGALEQAKLNLKWNPLAPDALTTVATLRVMKGQYVEGYELVKKALEINPADQFAKYELAEMILTLDIQDLSRLSAVDTDIADLVSLRRKAATEDLDPKELVGLSDFKLSFIRSNHEALHAYYSDIIQTKGYANPENKLHPLETIDLAIMISTLEKAKDARKDDLKSKLETHLSERPLGADSNKLEYLGAMALAMLNDDLQLSLNILDQGIENQLLFLDIQSLSIFASLTESPEFESRRLIMKEKADKIIANIE